MIIKVCTTELQPILHEGEGEVISVFLNNEATPAKNFRCINCGKVVCQPEGNVRLVAENGPAPEDKNFIDIMCHRCKIIYRFI